MATIRWPSGDKRDVAERPRLDADRTGQPPPIDPEERPPGLGYGTRDVDDGPGGGRELAWRRYRCSLTRPRGLARPAPSPRAAGGRTASPSTTPARPNTDVAGRQISRAGASTGDECGCSPRPPLERTAIEGVVVAGADRLRIAEEEAPSHQAGGRATGASVPPDPAS